MAYATWPESILSFSSRVLATFSTFSKFFLSLTISRVYDQQYGYPKSPKIVGEHIREWRMDLELRQRDVAGENWWGGINTRIMESRKKRL